MRAIVILYKGEEASEYIQTRIITELATTGVITGPEPTLYQLDEGDIVDCVIKHMTALPKTKKTYAEDKAIIYIGDLFKKEIATGNNFVLMSAIMKKAPTDPALRTALEVLKNPKRYTTEVATKYGFTPKLFTTLKEIANVVL